MLHISYLFTIMYHDMQKLNKAALKEITLLFLGVIYIGDCSVHLPIFQYGTDNWNWYFVTGLYL